MCTLHQVDGLSTQQRHHIAEGNALAECQTLIQEAAKAWDSAKATSQAKSTVDTDQARRDYMHAATRHLYYQRALLQLLLRQLNFCVSELQGMCGHQFALTQNFPYITPGGVTFALLVIHSMNCLAMDNI